MITEKFNKLKFHYGVMDTRKKIILGIVLLVIVAMGGFFVWRKFQGRSLDVPQDSLSNSEVVDVLPTNNLEVGLPSDDLADILAKPLPNVAPILARPIPVGVDENMVSEIKKVIELIRGNYDFRDGWINLGIYREKIKDYEGAAEAWKYASAIRPFDPVPLINLGDLYGYYVHDNKKAELYFLKAIEVQPKEAYAYYRAYEFYADISEITKAKDILKEGIVADPAGSGDLKAALDNLQ